MVPWLHVDSPADVLISLLASRRDILDMAQQVLRILELVAQVGEALIALSRIVALCLFFCVGGTTVVAGGGS